MLIGEWEQVYSIANIKLSAALISQTLPAIGCYPGPGGGIRKTLGASVGSIVYLFSREFTLLVLLAFLIAAPAAGYSMNRWLQGPEGRTDQSQ